MSTFKLLTVDGNPKVIKGEKQGYLTAVLHLAPANLANPGYSVCPSSTEGCRAACLNTAGRGGVPDPAKPDGFDNTVQRARVRRTLWLWRDRPGFVKRLIREVELFIALAHRRKLMPCVRLNGTSDLMWPALLGVKEHQRLRSLARFYDYTKVETRAITYNDAADLRKQWHLTYSATENDTPAYIARLVARGVNVAVVFGGVRRSQPMPGEWHGMTVIDGDKHDLRFLDPVGVVVGLRAKGRAKHDTSGFVRHIEGE